MIELYKARVLLYRRQILQENIRWNGKLLTRSTRFACFCTAQTSIFQLMFVDFLSFSKLEMLKSEKEKKMLKSLKNRIFFRKQEKCERKKRADRVQDRKCNNVAVASVIMRREPARS